MSTSRQGRQGESNSGKMSYTSPLLEAASPLFEHTLGFKNSLLLILIFDNTKTVNLKREFN